MRESPGHAVAPCRAGTLRVATYNIHRAVGTDRRRDPGRIAAVIDELAADVIGLQEVDWHRDWHEAESPLEMLEHLSGYEAVPGPNLRDHRGHYGNLLLTRLPLAAVRRIDLSEAGREPRGAIDADLVTPWGGFRAIVTHLGLGPFERRRQAARLTRALAAEPAGPGVLLGDLNDWLPGSPTLKPLLALCDSARGPASFPARFPCLALDRALGFGLDRPPTLRRHASPLARIASDHLPVVMDIAGLGAAGPAQGGEGPVSRQDGRSAG